MYNWILSIFIGLSIYYFINTSKFHSIVAKILLPAALIFVVFIVINQMFVFEGFESGVVEEIKGGSSGKSSGKGGVMKLSKPNSGTKTGKSDNKGKSSDKKDDKEVPEIMEIPEEEGDNLNIENKDKSSKSDKIEKKQLKTLKDIEKTLKANKTTKTTTESFEDYAPYNVGDEAGSYIHEPVYIDNYKLFSTIQNNLIG